MNVFDYLSTVAFCTNDNEAIDPNKSFDQKDVKNIPLSYEKYCEQFGCSHDSNYGAGELARLYPGLFRDDIALSFHPNTSPDYARFKLALNMMSYHIYYYAEQKHTDDGGGFNEWTGFQEAKKRRKSYVVMENLS